MDKLMTRPRGLSCLIRPVVSEKASVLADRRCFSFYVEKDADKDLVACAVESFFSVLVDSVRVLNIKGKVKRGGVRKDRKKVYVFLKDGYDIQYDKEVV
jgi:large subunit ribosomal protein L23